MTAPFTMDGMANLDDVTESLFFPRRADPWPTREVSRLEDGSYNVDYGDPDHVFLVTVSQVPRIRLPLDGRPVVGSVGGVRAELVQVTVANVIEVTVDAEPGAPRSDFQSRYDEWVARGVAEAAPPWPAEQFLTLPIEVSDDVGTHYAFAFGGAGGAGTEWQARWSFRPPPPAEARRLTLRFGDARVDLSVPR